MLVHNKLSGREDDLPMCVGTAFDLWFGPDCDKESQLRETPRERRFRERTAKAVCAECPFVAACLAEELAFGIGEQWGVRGGKTAEERQDLIRARNAAADRDVVAEQAVA
ncbi:MAG: WhiB family transcriptional regulator [Umezawaea sp.]